MTLLVSLLLLVANGFFVGAEFALLAARRTRMEQLADEGSTTAATALRSMRELNLMLSGAQLGITMASLGLGFVAEPLVSHAIERAVGGFVQVPENLLHPISFALGLGIVVFLHMVVGEMVPKNIAIAEPERSAQVLAMPMRAYVWLFRPVIVVLTGLANGTLRLVRVEPTDEIAIAHSAGEIAGMVAASREEGLIEPFEHELLAGALLFGDRPVASVMVPSERVDTLELTSTVSEAERLVLQSGHSRLPVRGRDGEPVGFVHAKDLLSISGATRNRPVPREAIRRALVVPATAKLRTLLVQMRRAHTHFALVRGGDGRAAGIVTLEDVLEELVGDIRDEHDVRARRWPRRRRS